MGSHLRVVRPGGLSRLRGWLQAALEVARARKELPAGRWPRHRAPGLCGAAGSARHAGHCYPTVAGAQAFREKTFCKVKPTTNPATLMGWLGRVWVFDLIKGFFKGKTTFGCVVKRGKFWIFGASFLEYTNNRGGWVCWGGGSRANPYEFLLVGVRAGVPEIPRASYWGKTNTGHSGIPAPQAGR